MLPKAEELGLIEVTLPSVGDVSFSMWDLLEVRNSLPEEVEEQAKRYFFVSALKAAVDEQKEEAEEKFNAWKGGWRGKYGKAVAAKLGKSRPSNDDIEAALMATKDYAAYQKEIRELTKLSRILYAGVIALSQRKSMLEELGQEERYGLRAMSNLDKETRKQKFHELKERFLKEKEDDDE